VGAILSAPQLPVPSCRSPVASPRLPVPGPQLPVAGCRSSVPSRKSQVPSCQLAVSSYSRVGGVPGVACDRGEKSKHRFLAYHPQTGHRLGPRALGMTSAIVLGTSGTSPKSPVPRCQLAVSSLSPQLFAGGEQRLGPRALGMTSAIIFRTTEPKHPEQREPGNGAARVSLPLITRGGAHDGAAEETRGFPARWR